MAGKKRKLGEPPDTAGRDAAAVARESASASAMPRGEPPREQLLPANWEATTLTPALVEQLFARYTNQMCHHLPGVVFPPGMTAAELRETKPILFLAVMAAASSEMPNLQRALTSELMQVFAEKIIVRGNKSLELVQALQVSVIWYFPPENYEELKFYQLVHFAAVMAIDIGLGQKKHVTGGFRKHIRQAFQDASPHRQVPLDPTTIEARRAWLACYFLATNTAMALHRPNLIRWTPFMAECIDVLESSPDAAPTDKFLCQLVWTHKLAEEVGVQFSMDDPASTPNIADLRTQYVLKGFELELDKYRNSIPKELQQRRYPTRLPTCLSAMDQDEQINPRKADTPACLPSDPPDELPRPQPVHARDRHLQRQRRRLQAELGHRHAAQLGCHADARPHQRAVRLSQGHRRHL